MLRRPARLADDGLAPIGSIGPCCAAPQVMGIELFRGDLRGRCFFAGGDMAAAESDHHDAVGSDAVCSLNAGASTRALPALRSPLPRLG